LLRFIQSIAMNQSSMMETTHTSCLQPRSEIS
jgi:hypothetical protein